MPATERIARSLLTGDLRRYAEGYARAPETAAEVAATEVAAAQLLAEEPWE